MQLVNHKTQSSHVKKISFKHILQEQLIHRWVPRLTRNIFIYRPPKPMITRGHFWKGRRFKNSKSEVPILVVLSFITSLREEYSLSTTSIRMIDEFLNHFLKKKLSNKRNVIIRDMMSGTISSPSKVGFWEKCHREPVLECIPRSNWTIYFSS